MSAVEDTVNARGDQAPHTAQVDGQDVNSGQHIGVDQREDAANVTSMWRCRKWNSLTNFRTYAAVALEAEMRSMKKCGMPVQSVGQRATLFWGLMCRYPVGVLTRIRLLVSPYPTTLLISGSGKATE